ncbi:GL18140 [Drosophila persimilis]|uniref:GL18140 n=1 Tax=Drosophila persimilis TaxID=7234 RepID=B4H884_DROPE|nr:GL18140 [Drosophila persimilis]
MGSDAIDSVCPIIILYILSFTANDWQHTTYPPVLEDTTDPDNITRDRLTREVAEVQRLVKRVCSYPGTTPFTTLCSLNGTNLELCGSVIVRVKRVI